MTTLPQANAKFALDFLRLLSEEHPTDNLVFSPVNLTACFGLLLYGSANNTAAELEKVLHWNELKEGEKVRNKRYLITRMRTSVSPAKFQEKDKIWSSPRPYPEQHAKSCDDKGHTLEPQHATPSSSRRQAPEPQHPKPHSERRQASEPQHPKPHDERQQAPEPEHPKPHDERRQAPKPEHPKPHDERQQAPEPEHPKPHDERRQVPKPEHPNPHDDRRQAPRHPFPRSKPEETACPQRCVPEYECENPEGVHTAFSKILAELNKPTTSYFLSFANKLSGDQSIPFIQKFLFCALKLYLTEVGKADFHNAPEEVRRLINLWVEVRSHGEIKDLLPENSLDSLTQLLMVNTIYFKGLWEFQFNKELTEEAPFYTNEKTSYTVQLMHTRGTYNTGVINLSNVEVHVLEIPYKNHEMSMFILLPKEESSESLLQLEDALSHVELLDWSHFLKPEDVEVAIPKFSIEKTAEADKYFNLSLLNDSGKADFSGATTIHGVALSQLAHDTLFEIDEEGGKVPTVKEAQYPRYQRRGPMHFVADHPFLFYVLHKSTQSIVIFGRFSKPE